MRQRVLLFLVTSAAAAAQTTWTQQQELTASDGVAGDSFGYNSTSVSGDTAVIGAASKNSFQGGAYVFVRSGGVWSQQQELMASDAAAGDYFGYTVSISGDTAVIGAYGKGSAQGAVYAFVRSGGVWTQQQELTASDGVAGDEFGYSVSVNGDTAVIAALGRDAYQGAAYVFVRDGGLWTQQQELTASDGAAGDQFGVSVSLSGDTAVVGAYGKNTDQGAEYVFVRSGGVWTPQQELTASDGTSSNNFGYSVSVSGNTAVIGAWRNNNQGAAYVFARSGGLWGQQQKLTAPNGAAGIEFGLSVSVSGDTAVIGAEFGYGSQGAAYFYARSGGAWGQPLYLTAVDGATGDLFGNAVSVSGDTLVIGTPGRNNGQGAAYVFAQARLGTNALLVGSAAGTSSVVLSYSGAWTATANASFLHVSSGSASGTGSGLVAFSYDAFTGAGKRTGTLSIAGLTFTVTQAGINYLGPGPLVTLVSSGLSGLYGGVAVDGSGNVYIADSGYGKIEQWSAATQQVTTIVPSGLTDPTGVAVDGFGNLYIANYFGSNQISEWSAATQQLTALVPTGLSNPFGVAVDGSGNVYIADESNSAIKEWNSATQQVTTLVSLPYPTGVAVDASGNVYVADYGNGQIYQFNTASNQLTTLVSSGLSSPLAVAVDGSGNVYIADYGNSAIKVWSPSTQQVTTLVSAGQVSYPTGVAVDASGNVYIADWSHGAITEMPYAFVGPASLTEPVTAGSDSLLPVLPSTASLTGIFAPISDQSWLTIGTVASGVVNFSFTANTSPSSRTAHIAVLGQQIAVTQDGSAPQTITFWAIPNQPLDTAPFTISAPASSNLPVSFASQTTSVCTVSGSQVTLVAIGTCTIQATQAGNNNYAAATPANQRFQVLASLCDLKQNGNINVGDVQAIINEALGSSQPVNDLNGDGVVNVLDVQIEINAAMGLYCTAIY
jgi:sugar lactone lactonase YvrE